MRRLLRASERAGGRLCLCRLAPAAESVRAGSRQSALALADHPHHARITRTMRGSLAPGRDYSHQGRITRVPGEHSRRERLTRTMCGSLAYCADLIAPPSHPLTPLPRPLHDAPLHPARLASSPKALCSSSPFLSSPRLRYTPPSPADCGRPAESPPCPWWSSSMSLTVPGAAPETAATSIRLANL